MKITVTIDTIVTCVKFGEAVRLPFSKGDEHWGTVRRRWGKAPQRLAERNALLIRSVKSAFALLLTKVTKPRLHWNG